MGGVSQRSALVSYDDTCVDGMCMIKLHLGTYEFSKKLVHLHPVVEDFNETLSSYVSLAEKGGTIFNHSIKHLSFPRKMNS
jgi:hypothetical protein